MVPTAFLCCAKAVIAFSSSTGLGIDKMRLQLSAFASLLAIALVAHTDAKKHSHHHSHHKPHRHSTTAIHQRDNLTHQIGIPWGCDPACVNGIKSTHRTDMMWYHHWQDTCVAELDTLGFEYVPTFWGPSKWDKWSAVKSELAKRPLPKYMLAFNEPDVQGQSNLGPKAAARLWMKELKPFADKGVQVGSPQVCWNMQWLDEFMGECKKLGCNISFIALHWYGSYRAFDKFTKWVSSVHEAFGLPIWVTEYGVTQASGGSQEDIKQFHMRAVQWMRQQGYVQRSAWLGGFPVNQKPDPYPSSLGSYFNGDGSARDLLWWASHSAGGTMLSLPAITKRNLPNAMREKELLSKPDSIKDEPVKKSAHEQYDEDHCDYKCQLRQNSIEKHHRKLHGIAHVDSKQVCVDTPSKLDRDERRKLSVCLQQAGLLAHHKAEPHHDGKHGKHEKDSSRETL